jgi:hypothetical protein
MNGMRHGNVWYVEPPNLYFSDEGIIFCDYELIKLQDERHSYEKCQYDEFKKRVKKMDELRAAQKAESSS